MKIYFAGSIRAGRQDQQLYFEIVEMLKGYGKVLTEHVAAPDCNATFETNSGQKIPSITKEKDRMIFDTDMAWLNESDFVVAEITQVSAGVGFELGVAWQLNKPVLCLRRSKVATTAVSAMINGAPNVCEIVDYETPDQLTPFFEKYLKY